MIVSLTDFKNFLGVDIDDTSKDLYYTSVLTTAEGKIKAFFGGDVAVNTYTETVQFKGKIFYTKYFPIISITSLTIDGNAVTDYVLENYYILFKNEYEDYATLSINYSAGFSTLPQEIYTAIILTAMNIVKMQTDIKGDQVSDNRLQREVEQLLLPYRRFPV
jgi:hypothetical protein